MQRSNKSSTIDDIINTSSPVNATIDLSNHHNHVTAFPEVETTSPTTKTSTSDIIDSGNEAIEHYKVLPAYRYNLRNKCLPFVRKETEVLFRLQSSLRSPTFDYYFAWTANLASHTFYVLMLPISLWFGSAPMARDLIFVLGFGIYISGNLKDFLCLPRPRSPPLHRITLSSYTALEYGFPSSHSANATSVTLVIVVKLLQMNLDAKIKVFALAATFIYYVSLIFGRLYCGMHGFFDVATGSFVGLFLFLFRHFYGQKFDDFFILDVNDNFGYATPVLIIGFYLLLIHIHFEPVDNCPCFDDSVAFVGVLIGLDLSHWLAFKSLYFMKLSSDKTISPIVISYDFSEIGLVKTIIRVIMGIVLVVTWQTISKKVVFTILPPVYKFIGVNIPRRNFTSTAGSKSSNRQIRKTSISNLTEEEISFLIPNKKDDVGIQDDIDYYEMMNHSKTSKRTAKVFKPRYDVEIIGRLIIYAGISVVSVWGFAVMVHSLGLS